MIRRTDPVMIANDMASDSGVDEKLHMVKFFLEDLFFCMEAFVRHNADVYSNESIDYGNYGIVSIQFPHYDTLFTSLIQGFYDSVLCGNKDGSLLLSNGKRNKLFTGYNEYFKHQGEHSGEEQKKVTTLIPYDDISYARNGLKKMENLLSLCTPYTSGLYFFQLHVLRQTSTQALFTWHRDTEEFDFISTTIVVLLTSSHSTMQVAGKPMFVYPTAGTCAIFPADATHRSGTSSPGTIKIALFFAKPRIRRLPTTSTKYCFCGLDLHDGPQLQCDICHRWCHIACTGLSIIEAETRGYTCSICDSLEKPCTCETLKHIYENFSGNWIQCDSCDRWCHQECTNFTGGAEDDGFLCDVCVSS